YRYEQYDDIRESLAPENCCLNCYYYEALSSRMDYMKKLADLKAEDKLLQERSTLRAWTVTISLGSPNLSFAYNQIATYLESKPFCKFSVSSKECHIAVMSHDRDLEISYLDEEELVTRSRVKVLPEDFPEWCILKWSQSGSLLISTRSNAIVDIFDALGGYCYSIPLNGAKEIFEAANVIIDISTTACRRNETKWLDMLYILQLNSTFHSFKIGRLTGYFPVFSVDLGHQIATSFILLPVIDILIVASQYKVSSNQEKPITCSSVGLSVYRIVDEAPYVIDVKTCRGGVSAWQHISSWIGAIQTGVLLTIVSNSDHTRLACISTTGDIFIFALPSMRLQKQIRYSGKGKPAQLVWIGHDELVILTNDGLLFRGNVEEMESMLLCGENEDAYSSCAHVISPHPRALFILEAHLLSSCGARTTAFSRHSNRAWLAAKLRLTTLYDYFKVYVGWAVGQPLEKVSAAREQRQYHFILHAIRSITLHDMMRKLLARGDFRGAIELAEKHDVMDVDFVYKEQWRQLGPQADLDAVNAVLACVRDECWVVCECVSSRVADIGVQRALSALAVRLTNSCTDSQRAFVLHNARILRLMNDDDIDAVDLYFELRERSLFDVAIFFAQTCRFKHLNALIAENYSLIRYHIFALLWMIPEFVDPRRYAHLMPYNRTGWFMVEMADVEDPLISLQGLSEEVDSTIERLNFESDVYEGNKFLRNYRNIDEVKLADVVEYIKARAVQIDEGTGLVNVVVYFVQRAIDNGFEDLKGFLVNTEFYRDYVLFCGSISMSLVRFNVSDSEQLFNNIIKYMGEEEICANMSRLVEFAEYLYRTGRCDDVEAQLRHLVCAFCKNSLRALSALQDIRRNQIANETRIAAFCAFQRTGQPLIIAASRLGIEISLVQALEVFSMYNFETTFDKLYSSLTDSTLAAQMLFKMVASSTASTRTEWTQLKNDLLALHASIYSPLLTKNEVLKNLALQILEKGGLRSARDLLDLVLSFDSSLSEQSARLSKEESINVLVEKSTDYWNMAEPVVGDPNLHLAREVLSLIPPKCSSVVTRQLRQLDALELALRLGSTLLPVKFRYVDPNQILSDVVKIGSNYKKAKDCARLAQLLQVRTPVARAMELCAVEALLAGDERTLRKYCEQLIKTAKGLSSVHSLCIDVIHSKFLKDMDEELLACALMNCPQEDLEQTLQIMREMQSANTIRDAYDPRMALGDDLILDPMYTPVEVYHPTAEHNFDRATEPWDLRINFLAEKVHLSDAMVDLVRAYTRVSASVAVQLSLTLDADAEWTLNSLLERYSNAVREWQGKIPLKMLQLLPPELLIASSSSKPFAGDTPIQRILHSGCDRERFLEDAQYRIDTLVGLAMTTDQQVLSDCLEVAEKYRIDQWSICLSTLEYVLTEPEVPTEEMTRMCGVLKDPLCAHSHRLHIALRSKVLRELSMFPRDIQRFQQFLSFFADSEAEAHSIDALKEFAKIIPEVQFPALLSGDPDIVLPVVLPYLSDNLDRITTNLRQLPNGAEMCEHAARSLLSSHDGGSVSVRVLFKLLDEKAEFVVDALGTLPLLAEEDYIKRALSEWNFDSSMDDLRMVLESRLEMIRSSCEVTPSSDDSFISSSSIKHRRISKR
uniref:Neuroblastoma-amplified sequence n=2 Tax=Parascaris univalens TaxID=6257 RepID=A0A915B6I6_PARUN